MKFRHLFVSAVAAALLTSCAVLDVVEPVEEPTAGGPGVSDDALYLELVHGGGSAPDAAAGLDDNMLLDMGYTLCAQESGGYSMDDLRAAWIATMDEADPDGELWATVTAARWVALCPEHKEN